MLSGVGSIFQISTFSAVQWSLVNISHGEFSRQGFSARLRRVWRKPGPWVELSNLADRKGHLKKRVLPWHVRSRHGSPIEDIARSHPTNPTEDVARMYVSTPHSFSSILHARRRFLSRYTPVPTPPSLTLRAFRVLAWLCLTWFQALIGKRVGHVACGGFHSAAILESGELYTWGGGEHGQVRM